jgi:outer membrane lipoprotein carrier protein
MYTKTKTYLVSTVILLYITAAFVPDLHIGIHAAIAETSPSLDQILAGMEKRYANSKFSAKFHQESTIKAMEITDFASGNVYVRHPGQMRWEYEKPDKQVIITDGFKLWIYRPDDNQVMTGSAPEFFRDGRGASFLSDIKILRNKFDITLLPSEENLFHELKLIPLEKNMDVADIRLSVYRDSFAVARVITYNFYGDETRIELLNSKFNVEMSDDLFSFEIPEGADVLQLEGQGK